MIESHTYPPVSIVVPCRNRAHYLAPTIDSILGQDYPDLECIVVDGASTDGTRAILERYEDRIRWISEPDEGHADAINKGWRMSRGEIVAWLNADDLYVVPDAVRLSVDYLIKHPDVDVVYGNYAGLSKDGAVTSGVIRTRDWNIEYAVKYCFPVIMQPTSFLRKSILDRAGWVDSYDDHGLWLRIGLTGKIRHAPIHVAYVRRDPGLSNQRYISEGKVLLTKEFLSRSDLPATMKRTSFRRRAVSNAHLIAAIGIGVGNHLPLVSLGHILRALAVDPLNAPYVFMSYITYLVFHALPLSWQERIRRRKWPFVQGISGGSSE